MFKCDTYGLIRRIVTKSLGKNRYSMKIHLRGFIISGTSDGVTLLEGFFLTTSSGRRKKIN